MVHFVFVLLIVNLARCDVTSMTDKILKDIFKDYNQESRPAGAQSDRKKMCFLS